VRMLQPLQRFSTQVACQHHLPLLAKATVPLIVPTTYPSSCGMHDAQAHSLTQLMPQ
jgi:hypothetical protein